MRPVVSDRIAVVGIVAAFINWLCCISIIWGWAFDPSGIFATRVIIIQMAVISFFFHKRRVLLRWARSFNREMNIDKNTSLEVVLSGRLGFTRDDNHKRMKILATATITGISCFIIGTMWIIGAAALASLLGGIFLFSNFTWWMLELLIICGGSIPIAIGIVAVFYATMVVRESGGRDVFGAGCRDCLWASAVGFGTFGLAWWFGLNLIVLMFGIAGILLFVAMTVVMRGELSTHPRRRILPFGPIPGRARTKIAAVHAVMITVILLQLRLLSDIFGMDMSRKMVWLFLVLGILGYFLDRTDRKSRPPGARQISGAIAGFAAAVLIQAVEILICMQLDSGRVVMIVFAVLAQIPMSAFGAAILSNQRKTLAAGGGSAGQYMASVAAGLCLGGLLYGFLGTVAAGRWMTVIFLCLLIAATAILGARYSRMKRPLVRWMIPSAILAVMLFAGYCRAWHLSLPEGADVQHGLWLSSIGEEQGDRYIQHSVYPDTKGRRSEKITECLAGIMALRRGKWWIIASSDRDVPAPDDIPPRVYGFGSCPEPPVIPGGMKRYPPLSVSWPDYFRYSRLNSMTDICRDYYDGILIAPLPADHPHAWRCYNSRMLKRCASMRYSYDNLSGVVVLRTQAGNDQVRNILRIAQTFRMSLRSGWAVVDISRSGVDILIIGPDEAISDSGEDLLGYLYARVSGDVDMFLVPLKDLWNDMREEVIRQVLLHSPPPERRSGEPKIDGLRNHLRRAQGDYDADLRGRLKKWAESDPDEFRRLFGEEPEKSESTKAN